MGRQAAQPVPLQKSIGCACRRTGDRAHADPETINGRPTTLHGSERTRILGQKQQAAWKKSGNPVFGPASNLAVVREVILGGVRMASPRRAAGSSTGRRSSPSGRRSWGRGRGMPVCRSSYVRTWGTPFSCLQPSTVRRDPLHITHASRHGTCGSGYPACVRTCARAAACGDRQSNAASPFQAPTEPHGRFRGPSGCMGQDGVPGRQGSRPPMPFPLSLRSRRLFVSPSSPSAWSPYPSSACAGPFPAPVSFRSLS